ncbi:MAG: ATP-binding cassette domain-containing protein [Bacteroidota bacterium]
MSVVVTSLTKYYGTTKAVDNLSFTVQPGQIVGLLGPNGAGKTTVARMITGFLTPSGGSVEVYGKNIQEDPDEVRKLIGYLPEDNPLYPDMDVIEYLEFIARLQNVPGKMIPRRIKAVVETFDLQGVKHFEIGRLSKGYRQRVGLAQAMLHLPQVLILDEPTNGLDPNQILEFRQHIRQVGKEKAVILSTHTLSEVQAVCDRVIIIDHGKKLADSSISDLTLQFEGMQKFFIGIDLPDPYDPERTERMLRTLEGVVLVSPLSQQEDGERTKGFYIEARREGNLRRQLFHLCVNEGWVLVHVHRGRVQIEDIFHRITTGHNSQ